MRLSRADMMAFHRTWFKAGSATLIVVGDTTKEEIVSLLESRFRNLRSGSAPGKNIAAVRHQCAPSLFLVDRPGSVQSFVFAGHLAPPRSAPNHLAIETMNKILGGSFTSRINMNLREDKGWCYGAWSLVATARGQSQFIVAASVQNDKTSNTIVEIQQELHSIRRDKPPTADEFLKAQQNLTHSLAGRWETCGAIEDAVTNMVQYDLPEDYYNLYAQHVRALDQAQVSEAASKVIRPESLVWVVVGDRSKVEPGLRSLGLGDVALIDADGNVLPDE